MDNKYLSRFAEQLNDLHIMPDIKGIYKDGTGRVFIWFEEEEQELSFEGVKLSGMDW